MPYKWYNDKWNHYDCEDGADYEWNWDCPCCNKPMCDENWENIYTSFREHVVGATRNDECHHYCVTHKSEIPPWLAELDSKHRDPVLLVGDDMSYLQRKYRMNKPQRMHQKMKKRDERQQKRERMNRHSFLDPYGPNHPYGPNDYTVPSISQ